MMKLFSGLFRAKKRAGTENSFVQMPIFHQTLQFPFPLDWPLEPLHRQLEGGSFVVEFTAAGQNRENWQDKLIIQSFNSANDDAGMSAGLLLKMMKEELEGQYQNAIHYEELFSETSFKRSKIAVLMGLNPLHGQAALAQFGLYLIMEGEHDMYILQRAWKAEPRKDGLPMPRHELDAWLEDFTKTALLDAAPLPKES
ncbi:hypothetical protein KKE54_07385 [bacterium]|nr:hypothetical protein [bacterium]